MAVLGQAAGRRKGLLAPYLPYIISLNLIERQGMGLSIKHDEIERMIRQLASQRQSSLIQAIGVAVRNELEREGVVPMTDDEVGRRIAVIHAMQEEIQREGIDWSETEDEILGYDEFGVPEQPYLTPYP